MPATLARPTVTRTDTRTTVIADGSYYTAMRASAARWRAFTGPLFDGHPDLSVDATELGFHDNRYLAEHALATHHTLAALLDAPWVA